MVGKWIKPRWLQAFYNNLVMFILAIIFKELVTSYSKKGLHLFSDSFIETPKLIYLSWFKTILYWVIYFRFFFFYPYKNEVETKLKRSSN